MTTKGIIERVEVIGGVIQYRVRMPLFHEINGVSNVPTRDLPLAIFALPPHMEKTQLSVGDVVYCSLEDESLDNVIILGLLPSSKIKDTSGSEETESRVVIEQMDSLSFSKDGSADLPYNTRILIEETDSFTDRPDRNYVNSKEISFLKGLQEPLINSIEKLQETVQYLEDNLLHLEVRATMLKEGTEG